MPTPLGRSFQNKHLGLFNGRTGCFNQLLLLWVMWYGDGGESLKTWFSVCGSLVDIVDICTVGFHRWCFVGPSLGSGLKCCGARCGVKPLLFREKQPFVSQGETESCEFSLDVGPHTRAVMRSCLSLFCPFQCGVFLVHTMYRSNSTGF